MKRERRPFLKQKPVLYFDENFPVPVMDHFRKGSRWKKKIKVLSAIDLGHKGKPDEFHFAHCARNGYTLVSRDDDFNDDAAYPFANGNMHGVVIVKETKGNVQKIANVLASLLNFVLTTPFPKSFLKESKFIVSGEGCVMRGRDARTKEVKSLQIVAGRTKMGEVREYFSY
jgi:predicted nuclease of predicted toxin-antitoxin system